MEQTPTRNGHATETRPWAFVASWALPVVAAVGAFAVALQWTMPIPAAIVVLGFALGMTVVASRRLARSLRAAWQTS